MPVERHEITGREQWLALRKQDVTASVVGGLLGVHEYQTAYGMWALKTGRIGEDPDETPAMQRGRLLEPVAVALLRERHPDWQIEQPGIYLRDPEARIGATPDVFVKHPEHGFGIIQVKTVEPGIFRQKWRDDDHGVDPPLWIAVQAIVEAKLAGAAWAMVAPMVVSYGLDLEEIDVPLHDGVYDRVKAEAHRFWQMVEADTPPDPDYGRDGKIIAGMFADDNGQEIDLSGDNHLPVLLEERAEIKARDKQDTDRLKSIDNEIAAKMGPYERAHVPGWRVSRPTVHRKAYSVAATSYRRLTIKPIV